MTSCFKRGSMINIGISRGGIELSLYKMNWLLHCPDIFYIVDQVSDVAHGPPVFMYRTNVLYQQPLHYDTPVYFSPPSM